MSDLDLEPDDAFYDPEYHQQVQQQQRQDFSASAGRVIEISRTTYVNSQVYKGSLDSGHPTRLLSSRAELLKHSPSFKPTSPKIARSPPRIGSRDHLSQHLHRVLGAVLSKQRQDRFEKSTLSAQFRLAWNLYLYIDTELGGDFEGLSEAVTLTSEVASDGERYTSAYVCSEYVQRQWPVKGLMVLNAVIRAHKIRANSSPPIQTYGRLPIVSDGNFSIHVGPSSDGHDTLLVQGSFKDLFETSQLLCWMTAVFRTVTSGPVAYSTIELQPLTLPAYASDPPTVEIRPGDLSSVSKDNKDSCWHSIFRNMPIANGFAVSPRLERHANSNNRQDEFTWGSVGLGLELPFELMVILAGVKYPLEVQGGIVFRGDRSLLVPTGMYGLNIQWHLHDTESDISNVKRILDKISWYKTQDFSTLTKARTFLGYASDIKINIGTTASRLWRISTSHSLPESTSVQLSGLSMSAGSEGLGFFGAMLGGTFKLTKGLRANIQSNILSDGDRLFRSQKQPLLLYDDATCRGWLVPELSVVLNCIQSWASTRGLDAKVPSADASPDGGEAAMRAILEASDTVLETQRNGQHVTVWDKVQLFLNILQQRKEQSMLRAQEGPRFLRRNNLLLAWEYKDVIDMKAFPQRKQITLPTTLSARGLWPKIFEDDPETLILVCRGLGEPIQPTIDAGLCQACSQVPADSYALTATVECLQRMPALQQAKSDIRLTGTSSNPLLSCLEIRFGLIERVQSMGAAQVQTNINHLCSRYPNGALVLQGPRRPKFLKCQAHGTSQTLLRPAPLREDIRLPDEPLNVHSESSSTEAVTLVEDASMVTLSTLEPPSPPFLTPHGSRPPSPLPELGKSDARTTLDDV